MQMEATPFNRLIGEKDVLAAIPSEFLDPSVSKKDWAAAVVCRGHVLMTTYRFQFLPDPANYDRVQEQLSHRSDDEIESYFVIPLGCIASVKKKGTVIELITKDLRQPLFSFDGEQVNKASEKIIIERHEGLALTASLCNADLCRHHDLRLSQSD